MAFFQWQGSVQFGAFVSIPVRVKSAVRPEKLAFTMLHQCEDGTYGNAGYSQDWACQKCSTHLVGKADTVRGWKGLPVDDEYLQSLKLEKSKLIELDGLVPADQIDPRYYANSYDVTPEEGGEKAYILLVKVLERSGRVALGTGVFGDQESIVVVRPKDGLLVMELCYWPDDLTRGKGDALAKERTKDVVVSEQELALGDQLAAVMARDFDPSTYRNEVVENMKAYLQSVEDGEAAPVAHTAIQPAGVGLDLMAALTATIAAADAAKAPVKKAKKQKVA